MKISSNIYTFLYKKFENNLLCLLVNTRNFLKNLNTRIHFKENLYVLEENNNKLFVKNKFRLKRIAEKGLGARSNDLAEIYMLNSVNFEDEDNVVDVGANIGEIYFYFQLKNIKIKYCSIEPSDTNETLIKSFPNAQHFKFALSNKEKQKKFYLKENSGDNSLIKIKSPTKIVNINTKTLKFLEKYFTNIKLLKIDAEGGEPEILIVIKDLNIKINYISVDVGNERGLRKLDTSRRCDTILKKFGYSKINEYRNQKRKVNLYKKN
tara:strand:+ start:50 stop:844 length:795 start_codon:yes stop_codon:yes gene_type:complete